MSECGYIAIEGVIGAGKTTLARMISKRINCKLVLEKHEENPFLIDFYKDAKRYAFQTELFFLLSRYKQQTEELPQQDLFSCGIIADYHFLKNRIFAHITMDNREYALYDNVASVLEKDILTPDLVVYLQSNLDRLMYNIKLRDRPYEREMNPMYIETLINGYNTFFSRYNKSPLLVVNANKLDFNRHPHQFEELVKVITAKPQGRQFFTPSINED